jgi:hypothetical protein
MDARILKPLMWFGLLNNRREGRIGATERRLYRKAALFDRFLKSHGAGRATGYAPLAVLVCAREGGPRQSERFGIRLHHIATVFHFASPLRFDTQQEYRLERKLDSG